MGVSIGAVESTRVLQRQGLGTTAGKRDGPAVVEKAGRLLAFLGPEVIARFIKKGGESAWAGARSRRSPGMPAMCDAMAQHPKAHFYAALAR